MENIKKKENRRQWEARLQVYENSIQKNEPMCVCFSNLNVYVFSSSSHTVYLGAPHSFYLFHHYQLTLTVDSGLQQHTQSHTVEQK